MKNDLREKYEKLVENLKQFDSALIAYSGGVDSTFLLKAAHDALGNKIEAVTVRTEYIATKEIDEALEFIRETGIKHNLSSVPVPEEIKNNPENRCYLCKKSIFGVMQELAKSKNIKYVMDGSNTDDLDDYRPGLKALKEMGIKSPLLENGWTKKEIREMSKELQLVTWDKPAYACLLTRLPIYTDIKNYKLRNIEAAETYLHSEGFEAVRVRVHDDLVRIEMGTELWTKFLKPAIMEKVSKKFKDFGFKYITFDLEGYKMGSFNENPNK